MSVSLLIMGRRRPGQTLAEHRHHMRHVHGPLVLGYIASDPLHAPRRYVQNHVHDGIFAAGDPAISPLARHHDFLTEVGFADLAGAKASRETAHYRTHLEPDEGRMVDATSVTGFPVIRTVLAPAARNRAEPVKVAALLAVAPGIDEARGLDRWASLSTAFGRLHDFGHEQGRVPVPGPVRAVDLFRLDGREAAARLVDAYRAAVIAPLLAEGIVGPDGHALLIATEIALFAGDDDLLPAREKELA